MNDDSLDVEKIIRYFGGCSKLCKTLNRGGHKISLGAVKKWKERNSIPAWWLLDLRELDMIFYRREFDLSKFTYEKNPS
jgi:hypothetical protein